MTKATSDAFGEVEIDDLEAITDRLAKKQYRSRCPRCDRLHAHDCWECVTCVCGARLVFDEDAGGNPIAEWDVPDAGSNPAGPTTYTERRRRRYGVNR